MQKNKERHESFGLLSISRSTHSSHKLHLFGSSIAHGSTICLTISKAERSRDLCNNWYFPYEDIIEIEMSPTQFSDAITSFNMGPGTPVTIRRVQGKRTEEPPCTDVREEFEGEFKDTIRKAHRTSLEALKNVENILTQKTVKKSDLKKVKDLLLHIEHNIGSNLDFVYQRFNEQVGRSITEAKNEIEAFVENKIRTTGIESLGQQFSSSNLLKGKVEDDSENNNQAED